MRQSVLFRTVRPASWQQRHSSAAAGHPETTVEVYVQDGPTRPEDADGLIIRFAKQLGGVVEMQTKLVTRDLGRRLRATALGVEAVQLPDP